MRVFRAAGGSLLITLALLSVPAPAQSIQDHNVNSWFMYFGDHPIGKGWGAHLEAQVRRADAGLTWQQLLLRPGVNYEVNKHLMLTGGYAYVRSWPYGQHPTSTAVVPENRFFEQVLIKHPLAFVKVQHRLRQEQRLIGLVPARDADVEGWESRNRFRYMLRGDIPLHIGSSKRFGIALYDEIFVQFGANRGPRHLDQNRAYGAFTIQVSKSNRFEVGYLHQYIPQRNGLILEHNHTLQFALFSNAPIKFH